MKKYVSLLILFGVSVQAQINQNQFQKFIQKANENFQLIQEFRSQNSDNADEYQTDFRVISPFLDYDFEILQPLTLSEDGRISMKIKYLSSEENFTQTINGNLADLTGFGVDIYFILEFENGSLKVEYEYEKSGIKEVSNTSILHLGVDGVGLIKSAEKAGLKSGYIYE